jgi:CubicO group peptidase (beta-lactamase class C family)
MENHLLRVLRNHERLVAFALFAALLALSVLVAAVAVREGVSTTSGSDSAPDEPDDRAAISVDSVMRAREYVLSELDRGAFPGGALAIGVGDRIEHLEEFGRIGWREAAAPVEARTTKYDLASVTKAVATTIAVLILADDGAIDLDDPVQPHLPEFEGVFKERITWRHLLSHTSGLPGGAVIRGETSTERVQRLLRTRTMGPGQMMTYTDLGFLVLWEAAQRVAGEPLEGFLERRVWKPLQMHSTAFSPGQDCEECAPTLRLSTGIPFRGQPNDLLARRLGGVTGNAGLFSTAEDLARFAAMIAGGGVLDGVRILKPESVQELFTQQAGAGRRTLGWVAFCHGEGSDATIPCSRPIAFGHTGWAGTSLWVEREGGAWVVLLTNRSYDVRAEPRMDWLRESVFRAVTGGTVRDPAADTDDAASSPGVE